MYQAKSNDMKKSWCAKEKIMMLYCVSPVSGVFDETVAAGPEPAFVLAQTLNVYSVKGFRLDITKEVHVVSASSTRISSLKVESAPIT